MTLSSLFSDTENAYNIAAHHLLEGIGNDQQELLVRRVTQVWELLVRARQV